MLSNLFHTINEKGVRRGALLLFLARKVKNLFLLCRNISKKLYLYDRENNHALSSMAKKVDIAKYLADKRRYAGEKIPSMMRRRLGHDYEERRMYLITITVEGRRPLLGHLAGDLQIPYGTEGTPHIVLSPLGRAVEEAWMNIPHYYPEVKVVDLQLMPDHLHGILFVQERMSQHLGHIIKGFKAATNRAYRELVLSAGASGVFSAVFSAATMSQHTVTQRVGLDGKRDRSLDDRKHGLLWSIGYTDGILDNEGQLQRWKDYLRDNPRRLLMKRQRPDLFRVQRNVQVEGEVFSAIGNRYLLERPVRLQVKCSRSLTDAEIEERKTYFLEQARQGAVLVSPSISKGEKAVMRAAFDLGYPLILLQENGFTDLAKPGGKKFDACAEGRLLILAPWEHHNERRTIRRDQCLTLNDIAAMICGGG